MVFNYGFLSHSDPLVFDPNNYISTTNGFGLFLTQVAIIIVLCQILGKLFKLIGQPAVVGELLAGILLGPTALGNIPGFTETIVPQEALGLLKLMASIGLSLFLFVIGLETDTDLMAKYWQKVLLITLPGMAIPFGIAVGISRLIWQLETDQTVNFTTFFLFVGTVMAVTSLSVLSRIMAEMNILSTRLGCITIAAGVCNDLIGYVLLALGSALGTGGKKIDALFQLLAAAGYIVILWFVFRPLMNRLIVRSGFDMTTGAEDCVPEHLLVIALVGALISAFYTDSMGVHPIVGAFAFGVCCPHGNFAVKVTESIETLVMLVLLPLYFVTSGLSTNFKLLDDGTTWGLICLLVVGIFVSKFSATAVSAKLAGMTWRESMCVASLMQSKGIIEIIILNVALQLEVVSPRVFAMLVICFLCTTLSVRPLSRYVYFSSLAQQGSKGGADDNEDEKRLDVKHDEMQKPGEGESVDAGHFPITIAIASPSPATKSLMFLLNLLGQHGSTSSTGNQDDSTGQIAVDLLRLLPIEYRTSSIIQLINYSEDRLRDEMMESLKQVQRLCRVPTSSMLAHERKLGHMTANVTTRSASSIKNAAYSVPPDTFIVPRHEMIKTIAKQNVKAQQRLHTTPSEPDSHKSELGSGMVLVTWEAHNSYGRGLSWLGAAAAASGLSFFKTLNEEEAAVSFWQANSDAQSLPARLFRNLRRQCSTGVLLDPSLSRISATALNGRVSDDNCMASRRELERTHGLSRAQGVRRIVVPFFGGADDKAAVEILKKIVLGSSGRVQGLVITFANSTESKITTHFGSAEDYELKPQMEALTVMAGGDEENVHSMNLQTIHQQEAARVDAKFFFHQQDVSTTKANAEGFVSTATGHGMKGSSSSGSSNEDEAPVQPIASSTAKTETGIVFLNLLSNEDSSLNPIKTMSKVLLPLLDEQVDMVFLGRGKGNQRPKEFRAEVEKMHTDLSHGMMNLQEEVREELRTVGNCLGAVSEGLLMASLRACVMVIQAAQE
ncbi:related to potassium/hydrogen antiporter [Melanopsichium pennsylvanicum]|uniref:Related to potassium/hydrogen antiporter n=2 Tax=Melanopsichium pennsylvanicum TaxID=63383 RepID=A0AAJ4XKD4_9BASI|nr:related to potassium/hydrogen antiporter [Melanopsichium pennsylvanicum 4]SNX83902.1 related to potassium/hydrogen antiporter [Melanopsichium pennsylvanicum]